MAWDRERARTRIAAFRASVPEADIVVEDFVRYYTLREAELAKAVGMARDSRAILSLPRNRAITTHGVHIYANLMDFNDRLVDQDRESEASHRRALQLLHAHYSACDALISAMDIQRVDFHGPRLHAVVLTPAGPDGEAERAEKAMAFAAAFRTMVARAAQQYGENFQTRVRIGVDSGPAIAMDGGRKGEAEPVFIGSPANHAAKLADGDIEGVFPSPRVRELLKRPAAFDSRGQLAKSVELAFLSEARGFGGTRGDARLEEAYRAFTQDMDLRKSQTGVTVAAFAFHFREPPLRTIDYAEHPPSNAIRMPLVSIFADLDGFTAYVDNALRTGRVAEAVSNLHVLRAEMAAVLRDDFGGRKVRFVGDSIHGLLAVGDRTSIDETGTVREAVMAAAGIRSSFDLCRQLLPGVDQLGIAIGVELGVTPICRIGLRGESSVRTASSRATYICEERQRDCDGLETAIGDTALRAAPATMREAFGRHRKIANLTSDVAEVLFGAMPSPYGHRAQPQAAAPAVPMRAHARR